MDTTVVDALRVPGATLHYEVRGTGPLLLLIAGGGGDAAAYDVLGEQLRDRYTVVAYDPRGYSRSRLDGPAVDQQVEVHSDDAYRLVEHLRGDDAAYVFGGSSGALVAMDLLVRHPEVLRRVVAHEPPAFAVLPDAARHLAMVARVHETYRREGPAAAAAMFAAEVGMADAADNNAEGDNAEGDNAEGDAVRYDEAMMARLIGNVPDFMEYELRQFTSFVPDLEGLRAHTGKLVLAGGRDSGDQLPYQPVAVMAQRLGIEVARFPGGHGGSMSDAVPFARELDRLLRQPATGGARQPG